MDRGYCSPSLWRRIDSVGGYFLTRVPKGWNQVITSTNRRHRGRARKLRGKNLQDALRSIKRQILDVNVVFRCRVRGYRGQPARKVDHEFRVIGLRRPDGELALYVTNAPPEMLSAEAVWDVYRLRWEVETFFKTAKSGCALNELPSKNRHRVEALVYAALIRAHIAMTAKGRFIRTASHSSNRWLNPGQWIRWWNRQLHTILDLVLGNDAHLGERQLWRMLSDPNVKRIPTRTAFQVAESGPVYLE